jgi:hypothetical protein
VIACKFELLALYTSVSRMRCRGWYPNNGYFRRPIALLLRYYSLRILDSNSGVQLNYSKENCLTELKPSLQDKKSSDSDSVGDDYYFRLKFNFLGPVAPTLVN